MFCIVKTLQAKWMRRSPHQCISWSDMKHENYYEFNQTRADTYIVSMVRLFSNKVLMFMLEPSSFVGNHWELSPVLCKSDRIEPIV